MMFNNVLKWCLLLIISQGPLSFTSCRQQAEWEQKEKCQVAPEPSDFIERQEGFPEPLLS